MLWIKFLRIWILQTKSQSNGINKRYYPYFYIKHFVIAQNVILKPTNTWFQIYYFTCHNEIHFPIVYIHFKPLSPSLYLKITQNWLSPLSVPHRHTSTQYDNAHVSHPPFILLQQQQLIVRAISAAAYCNCARSATGTRMCLCISVLQPWILARAREREKEPAAAVVRAQLRSDRMFPSASLLYIYTYMDRERERVMQACCIYIYGRPSFAVSFSELYTFVESNNNVDARVVTRENNNKTAFVTLMPSIYINIPALSSSQKTPAPTWPSSISHPHPLSPITPHRYIYLPLCPIYLLCICCAVPIYNFGSRMRTSILAVAAHFLSLSLSKRATASRLRCREHQWPVRSPQRRTAPFTLLNVPSCHVLLSFVDNREWFFPFSYTYSKVSGQCENCLIYIAVI